MCIFLQFLLQSKNERWRKKVPDEGTGPLPPVGGEITVLGDGVTYLTDDNRNIIVLPDERAANAVRNVLASQADANTIPL